MKKVKLSKIHLPQEIIDNIPYEVIHEMKKKETHLDNPLLSGLDLFNRKDETLPKLLDPFFQKVGLAALVGPSDTGKSTFLRQLAIHIAFDLNTFLNFSINSQHKRVLCLTTEDDPSSVSFAIKKQARTLLEENPSLEIKNLKNIIFSFNPDDPLEVVTQQLTISKFDLIIIDAFADVFTGEINANTQVRKFLNDFDKIAKKHKCLILFLHHIGKNKENTKAHKDHIIGSQAFEAKMRSVLELRMNRNDETKRDLWVLKGNFLSNKYKKNSYVLNFNKNLIFTNTNSRGTGNKAKSKDPEVLKLIEKHYKEGKSIYYVEEKLANTSNQLKSSSIAKIIKENNITKQ